MPKTFLIDTSRCTACRGCQLACKDWHNLPAIETKQRGSHQNPPDLNPCNLKVVRFNEYRDDNGRVHWNFFPDQCRHCLHPSCKDFADTVVPGAVIQDEKTGAVIFTEKTKQMTEDDFKTMRMVCPYNIPRRNPETGLINKCDMCLDRVQHGMLPMCVKTCPTGTMQFGERKEILALAQKRLAEVRKEWPKAFLADYDDVNVIYLLVEEEEHYYQFAEFN